MNLEFLSHDAHVLSLRTRMPFKYGIASMTAAPHVMLRIELAIDGQRSSGIAADVLPPKWFTKNPDTPYRDDVRDMIAVIRAACGFALEMRRGSSVFDLWSGTHSRQSAWGAQQNFPPLLWNFGVSLVERAMIDAFCRGTGVNFAAALRRNLLGFDLRRFYTEHGVAFDEALADLQLTDVVPVEPLRSVIVRHTVGLGDWLTAEEIPAAERLADGLPQSLEQCIRYYGLTHFKIKLSGAATTDVPRLKRLAAVIADEAPQDYAFTLDANENFKEIGPFRAFWNELTADRDLEHFLSKLIFVEQPLHRDVALGDAVRTELLGWAERPPIIIDESDGAIASFPRALECGYIGTSHKDCKGVFKSLANATLLAHRRQIDPSRKYLQSGEDLVNIGPVALLQDLAVAANLGIKHVERNGHHYFKGLSMLPAELQQQVLAYHGDLYRRHELGFPTVNVRAGRVQVDSVIDAPLGVAFLPDPTPFTPLEKWDFASIEEK